MITFNSPVIRTVALAALVGGFAFLPPAQAQTVDNSQPAMDQAPAADAAPDSAMAPASGGEMKMKKHGHMGMMGGAANVETRIKTLHDKLMIGAQQENDWNAFAQTMRDNEANIHQLIADRHENAAGMTAIDDLQSYQKIAQAHADGAQKLQTAFATVYNEMSEAQKKNADGVFGKFEGHGGMHGKKHSS